MGSGLSGSLSLGSSVSASVANGAVAINQAGGTDPNGHAAAPLDWASAFATPVTPIAGLTIQLTAGQVVVSGTLSGLNIFNVLTGSANFAVSETTVDVSLGTSTLSGATLITVALSNLTADAAPAASG